MKDNLDQAVTSDFLDSMDQEAEKMVRAARTTDHKEAVRAFIDKRKPAFSGHQDSLGSFRLNKPGCRVSIYSLGDQSTQSLYFSRKPDTTKQKSNEHRGMTWCLVLLTNCYAYQIR
jgi:hypothetical protein